MSYTYFNISFYSKCLAFVCIGWFMAAALSAATVTYEFNTPGPGSPNLGSASLMTVTIEDLGPLANNTVNLTATPHLSGLSGSSYVQTVRLWLDPIVPRALLSPNILAQPPGVSDITNFTPSFITGALSISTNTTDWISGSFSENIFAPNLGAAAFANHAELSFVSNRQGAEYDAMISAASAPELPTYLILGSFLGIALLLTKRNRRLERVS